MFSQHFWTISVPINSSHHLFDMCKCGPWVFSFRAASPEVQDLRMNDILSTLCWTFLTKTVISHAAGWVGQVQSLLVQFRSTALIHFKLRTVLRPWLLHLQPKCSSANLVVAMPRILLGKPCLQIPWDARIWSPLVFVVRSALGRMCSWWPPGFLRL